MKTAIRTFGALILLGFWVGIRASGWMSLYVVDVGRLCRAGACNKNVLIADRPLNFPATQLLFSWNALRPTRGYYVFYAQVRSSTTRRWSEWYKMAQWGNGVQRSFEQLMNREPSFCYVRLEASEHETIDACRLKVEAVGGASLADVARVTVAAAHFSKFVPEVGTGKNFSLPTTKIGRMLPISQMQINHSERDRICSPTSLSMILSYLLGRHVDPAQFAAGVYDDGLKSYGSWPFNVAQAFAMAGGRYYFTVTRLNSFAHLYDFIRRGLPVAVSVRGHMRTMPPGRTYADGHLLVVVGWDNAHKRVLVYDPAFETKQEVPHAYAIDDFLAAWERSYRLAYVVEPV